MAVPPTFTVGKLRCDDQFTSGNEAVDNVGTLRCDDQVITGLKAMNK